MEPSPIFWRAREPVVAVSDLKLSAATQTVDFLKSRDYEGFALEGDAVDEADTARIVAETVKKFGKVDISVNMAGQIHWSPIVDMELEGWQKCLMSYPTAAMLTTKHVARAMIAAGTRGSIIHILSTAAHFGEASGAAYTAAKAACLNLTRSAAMDLAHDGIRVNSITPCGMGTYALDQDERGDGGRRFRAPQKALLLFARRFSQDDPARTLSACVGSRLGGRVFGIRRIGIHHRRRHSRGRRLASQISRLAARRTIPA